MAVDDAGVSAARKRNVAAIVTVESLWRVLAKIDRATGGDGCFYLIGETSHLAEGWREWTTQVEFYADVPADRRSDVHKAIDEAAAQNGFEIVHEFPGDLIPLPAGYAERARELTDPAPLETLNVHVRHFDPYSVAYRFIARGDEPDYHIVLMYLDRGWITFEEMDNRLDALLPQFSLETIAQDPAEFRRKYRGLRQMWRKQLRPRTVHRPTVT